MFKYSAVIIEPRKHKALEFVLTNFLTNLSEEWGFIIFHGKSNKDFVYDILDNKLNRFRHRVYRILQLEVDNLSTNQYNIICKSTHFYNSISTDTFLIFQTDTLILSNNKNLINNFLQYDYVGAPWKNGVVGNGGLSLRRKSKMIEISEKVDINFTAHEDNYFCYQTAVPLNRPSFNEAQKFSVETIFHEKSFGIHACWKYLNEYELQFLINKYPEIKTLIELNK